MRSKTLMCLAGVLFWIGCGDDDRGATDRRVDAGGTSDDGETPPTWTDVYTMVIATRCMPCHTTPTGEGIVEGDLDMTTQTTAYGNLVGVEAAGEACAGMGTRVIPGNPDESLLYLKVSLDDPAPCGEKMPEGGPPLSAEHEEMIEDWILAGAKND